MQERREEVPCSCPLHPVAVVGLNGICGFVGYGVQPHSFEIDEIEIEDLTLPLKGL